MKSMSITLNPRAHTAQVRANNDPVLTISFSGRTEADVADTLHSLAPFIFSKMNEVPVDQAPEFAF